MSSDAYYKLREEVIQLRQQLEVAETSLREKDKLIYELRLENRLLEYENYFELHYKKKQQ